MEVLFLSRNDSVYDEVPNLLIQLGTAAKTYDSISNQVSNQMKNGYKIVYVKSSEGCILAAAGFVICEKLAWGKHIYIDDFITAEQHRSRGVGTFLMNWFKSHCKEMGCKQLHLDSNVDRFKAHTFYIRHGFHISSHHFGIEDV